MSTRKIKVVKVDKHYDEYIGDSILNICNDITNWEEVTQKQLDMISVWVNNHPGYRIVYQIDVLTPEKKLLPEILEEAEKAYKKQQEYQQQQEEKQKKLQQKRLLKAEKNKQKRIQEAEKLLKEVGKL